MRAVIQKSGKASVEIDNKIYSEIDDGYVILLGVTPSDNEKDIAYIVDKICNLRLFEEGEQYFDKSILEVKKQILLISQFTLYAETKKGRRPDFVKAAKREIAEPIYEEVIKQLKDKGIDVKTGIFGAMMKVSLRNEGPVTIILDTSATSVLSPT
ncbi:MAG: D-aminoacyl-tRNA deacylase [Candidatus Gracilibacteria bacterium]|jgi:D-tyrosyl-tRNA(Tyr) deacylase